MLVDRLRIFYIVGWSFCCVTKKVYRKKESMKLDSTIGTLKFEEFLQKPTNQKGMK
jgi:hypothetical protein